MRVVSFQRNLILKISRYFCNRKYSFLFEYKDVNLKLKGKTPTKFS